MTKEPPKPRNKDFGEKGQVLIRDPGKDFTSRHKQAEQEFKQSFQEYMAEKKKNPENPKRNLNKRPDSGKDPAKNPSKQIGYMAYPGAREHDRKREERPRDYNGYAPEQPSWYNQEVAPVGLATPNKDEYRQPRERLGSYNHGDYVRDSPTYQEMLESKRRHEAAYRRYDEPGLSHYPQTGQSDPADRYSPRRF
ncbi:hypothetical protein KUTeg_015998 [Tegillarca granosa]|uniref:Uncharacterized protein n=1 Tax=Tegillarca granosa TaxID=220873 RepID=A0ABQ9EJK6_TEGGR|nr:hypothetical protein KUTeg_015998 [Tegillarca granosa]